MWSEYKLLLLVNIWSLLEFKICVWWFDHNVCTFGVIDCYICIVNRLVINLIIKINHIFALKLKQYAILRWILVTFAYQKIIHKINVSVSETHATTDILFKNIYLQQTLTLYLSWLINIRNTEQEVSEARCSKVKTTYGFIGLGSNLRRSVRQSVAYMYICIPMKYESISYEHNYTSIPYFGAPVVVNSISLR